jgi:hypothetical protein
MRAIVGRWRARRFKRNGTKRLIELLNARANELAHSGLNP